MKKYKFLLIIPFSFLMAWIYYEWTFREAYNIRLNESDKPGTVVGVFLNNEELISTNPASQKERQQVVREILIRNDGNWGLDFASYKPHLRFKTNGLDLNVLKDGVIMNIQISKSQWFQYSAAIKESEFENYLNRVK